MYFPSEIYIYISPFLGYMSVFGGVVFLFQRKFPVVVFVDLSLRL